MERELYHYNHNHDKLGRFAKSGSGGSMREIKGGVRRKIARAQAVDRLKNMTPDQRLDAMNRANDAAKQTSKAVDRMKNANRNAEKRKQASAKRMDLSKMSDSEMRERINRELLERQYDQMFNPDRSTVSKGHQFVDRVLDTGGDVLAVGVSGLTIAVLIQTLMKG